MRVNADFDGKAIIPDEPLDMPRMRHWPSRLSAWDRVSWLWSRP